MAPHVMILDDDVCFARSLAELAPIEGYQPTWTHRSTRRADSPDGSRWI